MLKTLRSGLCAVSASALLAAPLAFVSPIMMTTPALAAKCGNNAGGYDAWKAAFANEAAAVGVKQRGLSALANSKYATKTMAADRNQKSFNYTLAKFMQVRGADSIVSQGRKKKNADAKFFSRIEAKYGVPAGPLLAIHGMETGFGSFTGSQNIVDAAMTLTYDCRRSAFFEPHAIAALKAIDRGIISTSSKGVAHAELGETQFLMGNVLKYGVDGDGNGRLDMNNKYDALASTANFLRSKGWKKGGGYQPGQANFGAIKGWNAAGVYQQAIAIMGAKIDG